MKLLKVLEDIWNAIKFFAESTYNLLKNSFALFWSVIAILIGLALNILDTMIVMINWVLDMLRSADVGSFSFGVGMGVSKFLAIANTFFPVDEFCRFYVAWMTIYLVFTAIRWIKSFIPRIHGWGITGD